MPNVVLRNLNYNSAGKRRRKKEKGLWPTFVKLRAESEKLLHSVLISREEKRIVGQSSKMDHFDRAARVRGLEDGRTGRVFPLVKVPSKFRLKS